jgi:hypothetical protein
VGSNEKRLDGFRRSCLWPPVSQFSVIRASCTRRPWIYRAGESARSSGHQRGWYPSQPEEGNGKAKPEQEGIEAIRALYRVRPRLKIIAISGQFAGPLLCAAEAFGAPASLARPNSAGRVTERVARPIAGSRHSQET